MTSCSKTQCSLILGHPMNFLPASGQSLPAKHRNQRSIGVERSVSLFISTRQSLAVTQGVSNLTHLCRSRSQVVGRFRQTRAAISPSLISFSSLITISWCFPCLGHSGGMGRAFSSSPVFSRRAGRTAPANSHPVRATKVGSSFP